MLRSDVANTLEEAEKVVAEIGLPCVIRPAYTMGGTGGGFACNMEEFRARAVRGLCASLVGQILVEESVLGWEEPELEVVRDSKNQMITVCFIENVDAMGVHTGDSYCTAPMLTIEKDLQERLQKYSYDIVEVIQLLGVREKEIRERREKLGVVEGWQAVPVSGVEEAAYCYFTYNAPDATEVSPNRKIMILGGGPNRIGQGVEFDCCCVRAAFALRDEGIESIMVNCNLDTVSTDYDTSNKLYFEALTVEDVLSIYEKEKPEGIICQFGGQTPLNIAAELEEAGVRVIGTTPDTIGLAEDRDRFRQRMRKLGIPQPESGMASTLEEAVQVANRIGYPLMVRPSFVLGGRAMEVVHDEGMLEHYVQAAVDVSSQRPILIDKFLENAIEAEADAIADGTDAFVPAVMEHIELAGVHSGDSACVIPTATILQEHIDTICEYTPYIRKAAIGSKVPYITTLAAAAAAAKGIAACREGRPEVRSLQSYHGSIG